MGDVVPFRQMTPAPLTVLDELDTYLLENIGMPFATMVDMLACSDIPIKVTVEIRKESGITLQDIANKLSHDVIDSPE